MPSQAMGWSLTEVYAEGQHPLLSGDICEPMEGKASGACKVEVGKKKERKSCDI